ncbi:MAG: carboxypeptidase-like regulatory domain-containing protein [Tenuifilum sp.]|uniref:carboxypeptidase-like regulatory domain-containing protein n=1 Tax=Tenuifilum sp. TaxID=2760880 RepID=UPI0030AE3F0F
MEPLSLVSKNIKVKPFWHVFHRVVLFMLIIYAVKANAYEPDSLLRQNITISIRTTTLFKALNQIGDKAGCFFIYDSRDVESNRRVKSIEWSDKPLNDLLNQVIGDTLVKYRVIGKHILLYRPKLSDTLKAQSQDQNIKYVQLSGRILDKETAQPVAFATVGIPSLAIGTISNLDGVFTLRIPKQYTDSSIAISHIGYIQRKVPAGLLTAKTFEIFLEPSFIPVQEIFIRNIDARNTVREAVNKRSQNYFQQDIYITAFYREGVLRNKRILSYSEAFAKIFKSSYSFDSRYDQVKLIRFRKMEQANRRDTLDVKLQAGMKATLDVDIMKNLPDFLDPEFTQYYDYTRTDIVVYDNKSAYAIGFKQKPEITDPLFAGLLYIDTETLTLLAAEFEINPDMVQKTASQLVVKRGRGIRVQPQKIKYLVKYQPQDGKWYVNHVRGEISLKVQTRFWPFANTFDLFFEYVALQVETLEVKRFPKRETLKTTEVFSNTQAEYDPSFWNDLNYIEPEESILKALGRITPKIEMVTEL